MRRRLVLAAVALTATIVLAFCIPLARLVRDIARDQAIATVERDVARVIGALSVTVDPDAVETAMEDTSTGGDDRLAVTFADGATLGAALADDAQIELGRASSSSLTVEVEDGVLLLTPVELGDGVAVVSALVPGAAIDRGVASAWFILAGVASFLLVVGVVVADRLSRSVTGPAVALADAARRVAGGDLSVRVTPAGPPELAQAATGFNDLAGRLSGLVDDERRAVADLAHRLRTPLAATRLDVEEVRDREVRLRLADDVAELERAVDTVIREARHPLRRAMDPTGDLAAAARDRVAFWSALADEQGRPWTADISEEPLEVNVPYDELVAIVDALLDNVFTHTPARTAFEVSVRPTAAGGRLSVRDHGPGLGASVPGRTGLGLDITARVASSAGGTFDAFDDGGAVIVVDLPRPRSDAPVPPADHRRHRVRERSLG